ncbi:MAG: TlpA family protein disulfide reductase, partial [Planctomycetes bacterium]|nr:TlpA family protein disulfide reductase [Planctomycetota bacterium]
MKASPRRTAFVCFLLLPLGCAIPPVPVASSQPATRPADADPDALAAVRAFLQFVADRDKAIRTIHVRYREEIWRENEAGQRVPNKNGHDDIYQCQWARDEKGALAGELVQTQTRITGQFDDAYRVKKDGLYWIHLDRGYSQGRGDGQIMAASQSIGYLEPPAMFIVPWSWVNNEWWIKLVLEGKQVPNVQMLDEERDGRAMRRITLTSPGAQDSLVIDLARGLMPVEMEHTSPYGYGRWRVLDIAAAGDGLWLPRVCERRYRMDAPDPGMSQDARYTVHRVTILPVRVNTKLPESLFRITWKKGTQVYDRTTGMTLTVDRYDRKEPQDFETEDPKPELARQCPLPRPVVGRPYAFELKDLDGKTISSKALKGKVVLISFWGSFARTCVEPIGQLKDWYEQYRPQGLEIVGISLDEDADTVRWCTEDS